MYGKVIIFIISNFMSLACIAQESAVQEKLIPVVQEGHSAGINSIAADPTGKYIVSASDDHTIKI